MKTKILAGMAMFVGVFAMTATASADPPKPKNNDVEYTFGDEKLLSDTIGSMGTPITVLKLGRRDRLHRPRTQFIAEMLKSVENM